MIKLTSHDLAVMNDRDGGDDRDDIKRGEHRLKSQ